MRLFRKGRSEEVAERTDSIRVPADWAPGGTLWFDGTVDKGGTRHTDVGVEIGAADLLRMAVRLLDTDTAETEPARARLLREAKSRLRKDRDQRRKRAAAALREYSRLDRAMGRIHEASVVGDTNQPEETIRTISEIATEALFDSRGKRRQLPFHSTERVR